jgi:hypothetical protein
VCTPNYAAAMSRIDTEIQPVEATFAPGSAFCTYSTRFLTFVNGLGLTDDGLESDRTPPIRSVVSVTFVPLRVLRPRYHDSQRREAQRETARLISLAVSACLWSGREDLNLPMSLRRFGADCG